MSGFSSYLLDTEHHEQHPQSSDDSLTLAPSSLSAASLSPSLYAFSSVPSYHSPTPTASSYNTLTFDQPDVIYRGVDIHSSPLFSLPSDAPHSFSSLYPSQPSPRVKKNELSLPSSYPVSDSVAVVGTDLSVSDPSAVPGPLPSYVEPYTSFYSSASPSLLLSIIPTLLPPSTMHSYIASKQKFMCSFLCPRYTSSTLSFQIRVYSDHSTGMLVVEASRRGGCSMGFSKIWKYLEQQAKIARVYTRPYTESPFSSSSAPSSPSTTIPPSPLSFCTMTALPPQLSNGPGSFDNTGITSLMNLVDQSIHTDSLLSNDCTRLLAMLAEGNLDHNLQCKLVDSCRNWMDGIQEDMEGLSQLSRLMLVLTKKAVASDAGEDGERVQEQIVQKWTACMHRVLSLPVPAAPEIRFHYRRCIAFMVELVHLLSISSHGSELKQSLGSPLLETVQDKSTSQSPQEEDESQVREWIKEIRARFETLA